MKLELSEREIQEKDIEDEVTEIARDLVIPSLL